MDLFDIFRTFHPNAEEYTFFSSARGTFSKIDHILAHKSSLSNFKKIEIISSIFSDHNAMRLDINYRKKKKKERKKENTCKKHKLMEIKQYINVLLNNEGVIQEIKRAFKRFLEKNDNENTTQKPIGFSKSSSQREVYSNTILIELTRGNKKSLK